MDLIKQFLSALADRINKQPVATGTLIKTMIALAVAFGLKWTAEQVGAVVVFAEITLAWWTYNKVTPLAAPNLPAGSSVDATSPATVVTDTDDTATVVPDDDAGEGLG